MNTDRYWLVVTVLIAIWAQINVLAVARDVEHRRWQKATLGLSLLIEQAAVVAACWFLVSTVLR